MPSPKHTHTKSAATSESYAGNRGKTALIHAIELLFFIKSGEFRKFHPSFITPSAEEFLDYIQSRYRKYVVTPSLRHRPLHTTPIPKPPLLFKQFLAFIHPTTVSRSIQSLIGCLYIVTESLSLYFVVKSAMTSNWRDNFCSSAFFEEFTAPVYWLLEHKLPLFFPYRADIITKITQILSKKAPAISAAIPSSSTESKQSLFEALSSQYIAAFQTVLNDEMYRVHFVTPLVFLFGTHGVPSCRDLCEGILKKYVEVLSA
jgi:hypothetical protein